MILVLIFEHIPILKQLPHFGSCRVFETYPGFETICAHFYHLVLGMGHVLILELISPVFI